jgi:nucleoside-diphosphate-sugar epimerase
MTRWLVTGAGGMLGTDLVAALTSREEPVTGMDWASLDITDSAAVTDTIARCRPDKEGWSSTARPGPPLTMPRPRSARPG